MFWEFIRSQRPFRGLVLSLLLVSLLGAGYGASAERLLLLFYPTWAEDDSEFEVGFRFASLERCTFQQGAVVPEEGLLGFARLWVDQRPLCLPEIHEFSHHLRYGQVTALRLKRGPPEFLPPGL